MIDKRRNQLGVRWRKEQVTKVQNQTNLRVGVKGRHASSIEIIYLARAAEFHAVTLVGS
jgi:hypothetical protein